MSISLNDVISLARELAASKDRYEKAAAQLALMGNRVTTIEDVLLPSTFRELGITELTLEDGRIVSLAANVSSAVTDQHWPDAERWLQENNRDAIIKNQVIAEFDKGQNDTALRILQVLNELVRRPFVLKLLCDILENTDNEPITIIPSEIMEADEFAAAVKGKKTIHPQTLKAEIRKCMAVGLDVPEDTFSIFITDHVKISNPK